MKTLDLEAILKKKNMALDEISNALDKAITLVYKNSKEISTETKKTLDNYKGDLKDVSKEKVDSVIDQLKKLSQKLSNEEKKTAPKPAAKTASVKKSATPAKKAPVKKSASTAKKSPAAKTTKK